MSIILQKTSGRSFGKSSEIYHLFYNRIVSLAITARDTQEPQRIIIPHPDGNIVIIVQSE